MTLVVMRERNWMFFLYGNEFRHQFVKDFATWAARERGINQRRWDHDRNISWTFRYGLLKDTWFSVGFKVQGVI